MAVGTLLLRGGGSSLTPTVIRSWKHEIIYFSYMTPGRKVRRYTKNGKKNGFFVQLTFSILGFSNLPI